MALHFFDTNVLLCLIGSDSAKADRAEQLLSNGGVISVQVLNEFASVASRKQRMPWSEIDDALAGFRGLFRVEPLTIEVHERGMALARNHGFAVYDALIVASALAAECDVLYSEGLQDGRRIEGAVTIRNPFRD